MLNFATNFNAQGPPDGIQELVEGELASVIASYADSPQLLREAVGDYFNVPSACVAHGAGSTEILFTLPKFLEHTKAVMFTPSFWEYATANQALDNNINAVKLSPEKSFIPDLDELAEHLKPTPANVYIGNPNNPTATKIAKGDLLSLITDNEASEFIIDETYLQFDENFEEETLSEQATDIPNLHVVHSFSKFFASPGIRSGALISDEKTIKRFECLQIPYISSPLTEVVLPWLLKQEAYIEKSRREMTLRRVGAYSLCRQFLGEDAEFDQSEANFMFIRLKSLSGDGLGKYLSEQGITIRAGSELDASLANYFRFCIRSPHENLLLMQYARNYIDSEALDEC